MTAVFADTYYFVALLVDGDANHKAARQFTVDFRGPLVTSGWIVVELANFMCKGESRRRAALALLDELNYDARVTIVPPSEELQNRGLDLYRKRLDKHWSLTDCTSFVIMHEMGITEALTNDHHFEQAGFKVLFQ